MRRSSNDPLDERTSRSARCILTRRTAPREELIRLALGPDGEVAPDVAPGRPGRGAWIGVDARRRSTPPTPRASSRPRSQRAFKTNEVDVPADLGERIEAALRQAALDRLGHGSARRAT